MNPIAFYIFGIPIRWYGVLISIGMIIGILIASKSCKIKNINYDNMIDIVLIAFPFAVIGARLYYVIFNLDYYAKYPLEIINIRQGGLAIHGGIIFALFSAYLYTKKKNLNFLSYADAAAPSIILAQAIGRWGNFFNQEAYGREVSLEFIRHFPIFIQNGMYIEGHYYHPTFLYESLWNIFIFIILIILLRKTKKDGLIFFSYIGLYSLGRFFIEGLRTDSLMLGSIRVAQLISLLGILVWLVYIFFTCNKRKNML
jgi:phosphatidylglycerol:prolipoprotein diacylglycerol transferase